MNLLEIKFFVESLSLIAGYFGGTEGILSTTMYALPSRQTQRPRAENPG